MNTGNIEISYKKYHTIDELPESDQVLIKDAKALAKTAYAPYSGFRVASVALMSDGSIVRGTNQENASYPIGLCAERVLLAAASSVAPGQSIVTIAITMKVILWIYQYLLHHVVFAVSLYLSLSRGFNNLCVFCLLDGKKFLNFPLFPCCFP